MTTLGHSASKTSTKENRIAISDDHSQEIELLKNKIQALDYKVKTLDRALNIALDVQQDLIEMIKQTPKS